MAKLLSFVDDTNIFENALNAWMDRAVTRSALSDIERTPRVLVVGESILNATEFNTQLAAAVPGIVIERRTYGGSLSPIGAAVLGGDVQARFAAGNLLKKNQISQWAGRSNVTVDSQNSPTTGRSMFKLICDGVAGQKVSGSTADGAFVVPAGTPPLTYSMVVEPGTISSFRFMLYNNTTSATIADVSFTAADVAAHGNLPARYGATLATYAASAGDTILAYIYPGLPDGSPAGYLLCADAQVNVGVYPATPVVDTTGTAQTPGTEGWGVPATGTERRLFDLVVIQFGANDAAHIPAFDHGQWLAALINGAAAFGSRVLVCTPPPRAVSDLSAWDSADPYQGQGYYVEARRVARARNAAFYDAVDDFLGSGLATNALMRDTLHPTTSTKGGAGIQRYVNAIAAELAAPAQRTPIPLGSLPAARLGAPAAANWTWTEFAIGTDPKYQPQGIVAGHHYASRAYALVSSTVGAQLTTTITGRNIGLLALADATTGGQVSVSIDGNPTTVTIDLTQSGVINYPHGYHVASGLAEIAHTVTITVVSGQARIIGVVAA